METRFAPVDAILSGAAGRVAPAIQLTIHHKGEKVFSQAYGWLDPGTRVEPVNQETLFDLASLTKLFTTTVFMILVEAGQVRLDQPVGEVLPGFNGLRPIRPYEDPLDWSKTVDETNGARGMVDSSKVTFRNLLAHNSGLPAWRPFEEMADAAAARQMALETFFAYPTGARVIYSDVGLILLGMAVEKLTGQRLDEAVRTRVTGPLGLDSARFLPPQNPAPRNVAPTELCRWRKRRIVGEVHDENAWRLGGIAGHAGLFANADDLARFGQMYLDGGRPLLAPETVAEMRRLQSQEGNTRRGVGFQLWSPDLEASSHPFSPETFGHTGFTGTCLWMDPRRELVVALLTNEVYNGRADRGIGPLRIAAHEAIVKVIDG